MIKMNLIKNISLVKNIQTLSTKNSLVGHMPKKYTKKPKSTQIVKSTKTLKSIKMPKTQISKKTKILKIVAMSLLLPLLSQPVLAQLQTNYADQVNHNHYPSANYSQAQENDRLAALIELKTLEYKHNVNILYNARNNARDSVYEDIYEVDSSNNWSSKLVINFENWLNQYNNRIQAKSYHRYLMRHVSTSDVPPMSQIMVTARSWKRCGSEPYAVPPRHLWHNMSKTLQLVAELKRQGILPADVIIRSAYRNRSLNKCVGGANESKHLVNSAVDLWSPSFEKSPWKKYEVQDRLCDFWLYQGKPYKFGLGLYKSGSIHIDTNKYRKWGASYSSGSSPCRGYP